MSYKGFPTLMPRRSRLHTFYIAGVDPGFLEKGSIWIALVSLIHFLKYPMKMKQFGLNEPKIFHFYRMFKNGTPESPLDPPLDRIIVYANHFHPSAVDVS